MIRVLITLCLLLSVAFAQVGLRSPAFVSQLQRTAAAGGGTPDILDEDFEGTGTPSGWTVTGTVDFDSTATPLEAAQSLKIDRTAAANRNAYYVLGSAEDELWGHYLFRPDTLPGTYDFIGHSFGPDFSSPISIVVNSDGTVSVWDSAFSIFDTTVATMAAGTIYHVWWHAKRGTGANAVAEVWFSTSSTRPGTGDFHAGASNGSSTQPVDHVSASGFSIGSGSGVIGTWDTFQVSTTDIW